jgi:hypothetical protein
LWQKTFKNFNSKVKMKNLDLNNYGVQEMNAGELLTTEGGGVVAWCKQAWQDTKDFCRGVWDGLTE